MDPANLAARLSQMQIWSSQGPTGWPSTDIRHLLVFECRALDLLPEGTVPFLTPPANLDERRRPEVSSQYSNLLGTSFFTMFEADAAEPSADWTRFENDSFSRLYEKLAMLKSRAGTSTLQMVTFDTAEVDSVYPDLIHRLRLQTEDDGNWEFELTDHQWNRLTLFAEDDEWFQVLQDLITRGSERAYFEVRSRLQRAYGIEAVQTEEAQWPNTWQLHQPRSVDELFRARLQLLSEEDKGGRGPDGDKMLNFQLPCGHGIFIRRMYFLALSPQACLAHQCPQCERRTLQRSDRAELKFGQEWDAVESYRNACSLWQDLDQQVPTNNNSYDLDSRTLLAALKSSLQSFEMPKSVCPASMCPSSFWETTLILHNLQNVYGREPFVFTTSALRLLEALYGLAMGTKTGEAETEIVARTHLTPNVVQFVTRWLMRAVRLLTQRTCRNDRCKRGELHRHNDGHLYSSIVADAIANNPEDEASMDIVLRAVESGMDSASIRYSNQSHNS